MLIDDEEDLRAGLRALGAPVPPPPAGRADRALGRARRLRRRRASLTAAAVLLPLVAGVAVTRPRPLPAPPPVDVADVANWPPHRDPALAAIERNVFTEWSYGPLDRLASDETVRWLYSGRVPGTKSVVVAFATCRIDRCTRTVLASGDEAEMAKRPKDDSTTHWLTRTRELAVGEAVGALSAYLRSASQPEQGRTNVLFVLPAPDTAQVTYRAPTRDGDARSGALARAGGAFVGDVGYLEAHAVVTVTRGDGSVVHEGPVGDDDSVGHARLIRRMEPPPGYSSHWSARGQLHDGDHVRNGAAGPGRHALFVRCLGAAPLRVELNGTKGSVPCDGRPRRATPLVEPVVTGGWGDGRRRPTFEYSIDGDDPYAVYALVLARRG